jgi:hypothetical protein
VCRTLLAAMESDPKVVNSRVRVGPEGDQLETSVGLKSDWLESPGETRG